MNNGETGIAAVDGSAPLFAPPDGQTAGDSPLLAQTAAVPLPPSFHGHGTGRNS